VTFYPKTSAERASKELNIDIIIFDILLLLTWKTNGVKKDKKLKVLLCWFVFYVRSVLITSTLNLYVKKRRFKGEVYIGVGLKNRKSFTK